MHHNSLNMIHILIYLHNINIACHHKINELRNVTNAMDETGMKTLTIR